MRRILVMLAVAAVASAGGLASPAGALSVDAAGCVSLSKISYDSPGADTGSNASRNAEWVQVKNGCSSARSLKGWKIRDTSSHVYTFGSYTLKAGGMVKIHTGNGTNTATDRYWGSRYYIWNNDGDKAVLRNAAGTTVDTCKYAGGGSATSC